MEAAHTGGCACGAVRFELGAAPELALQCYCRDCQRATGGACASVAVVPTASLRLLRGEPAIHEVEAQSGHTARRQFCSTCGSPLFAGSLGHPETIGVYLATLDAPSGLAPSLQIWTRSAPSWARLDPALPRLERGRHPA